MSPYATFALLALVLSVAAQDRNVQKTTVNTNINWNKQTNSAIGNVNVNGKNTPFTINIAAAPNQQPTFTIQSQNPAGKTTTVKIIPIKPIVANMPAQTFPAEPPKPVHHEVPVPIQSAAPPAKPVVVVKSATFASSSSSSSFASTSSSSSTSTSTFTSTTSEPGKPTVTVRSQTFSSSADPKPVTVTVVSMTRPVNEPVRTESVHPTFQPIPSPPAPVTEPTPLPAVATNDTTVQRTAEPEPKRRGCNKRLWIKGIILGLAAFGALAFLALCCRICRGRSNCCCRRRHRECEGNPTYGIPAPAPMNQIGQPQVFVVQAQPVNDPYFQPTPSNTNRTGQAFVQLNETNSDIPANYVIGYPHPNEQPVYVIPHRQ